MIHNSISETRNNLFYQNRLFFVDKKCIINVGDIMRYIIIFGVTLIISLFLIFYPQQYLMKYNDIITVDYTNLTEDNLWNYEISNNNIKLKENKDKIWTFVPNKNGKVTLTFKYDNNKYKIIYELKIKGNKIIWISGKAYGLLDYPNLY